MHSNASRTVQNNIFPDASDFPLTIENDDVFEFPERLNVYAFDGEDTTNFIGPRAGDTGLRIKNNTINKNSFISILQVLYISDFGKLMCVVTSHYNAFLTLCMCIPLMESLFQVCSTIT